MLIKQIQGPKTLWTTHMPGPLCHVSLALAAGVEALLAAPRPRRRRQDPHGLGVLRHEAAHLAVVDAAVAVRLPAPEDKEQMGKKSFCHQFLILNGANIPLRTQTHGG